MSASAADVHQFAESTSLNAPCLQVGDVLNVVVCSLFPPSTRNSLRPSFPAEPSSTLGAEAAVRGAEGKADLSSPRGIVDEPARCFVSAMQLLSKTCCLSQSCAPCLVIAGNMPRFGLPLAPRTSARASGASLRQRRDSRALLPLPGLSASYFNERCHLPVSDASFPSFCLDMAGAGRGMDCRTAMPM